MADKTLTEELDFDDIDDFIEFPSVNDTSLTFTHIWTNNSHELQVSDSIFSDTNCASTLSPELSVPYEDIVQLEWLSNFVEDSFSGGGMTINTYTIPVATPVSVLESSSSSSSSSSCSASSGKMIPMNQNHRGPHRARSKRPRPPVPVSSIESSWSHVVFLNNVGPDQKKPKKLDSPIHPENKPQDQNHNQTGQGVRKCMHCEITKTPQWRVGPMGPKTLCNACGVRYKSGRLFPEYRPAASPTFVPTLHSNSHKKVVEMRTKFMPNDILLKPETELIPNMNPHVDYI